MHLRSLKLVLGLGWLLCSIGPVSAHSAPKPSAVAIPEAFQGQWLRDPKSCPPEIVDQWISADKMRFDHLVGEATAVKVHAPRHITVSASLLSDGDPFEGDIDMKLSKSGNELTLNFGNGVSLRYRCDR